MMKKLGYVLLLVLIALTTSCEIGLGSSVDTDPPTLEITTPPVDSIIRDKFVIGGKWSDDGEIAGVSVTLKKTDGSGSEITLTGTITENTAVTERGTGTWSALVDPFAEDGTTLLKDGTYQATVTITDTVDRATIASTTFAVDNTAPVIVLTRPSTAADSSSSDTYGQTFNLEGQAADTNNVSLIEVKIYSDPECTEDSYLHTVELKNVPNSINMDVATFQKGNTENDYFKIYQNATTDGGAKNFYCRFVAYDCAQRFPVDGEQAAEDEKGNSTEEYYLYKDIATTILQPYKITEVYSILNGTYTEGTNPRSITSTDVFNL